MMRKSLLILVLGFLFSVGSTYACDGGKCAKTTKGTKASTAACMKDGKCTMKGGKCDMKAGQACDMKAAGGACDMKAGHCDMKAMKTGAKADKAAATTKHSCCAPKSQNGAKS